MPKLSEARLAAIRAQHAQYAAQVGAQWNRVKTPSTLEEEEAADAAAAATPTDGATDVTDATDAAA